MTRLFSILRQMSLAICATLSLAVTASAATTIQFDGKVEGATFAGYTPNSLADLTFSIILDVPDVTASGNFNPIPLDSFSGVTIGTTVYDTTNTLASVNVFGGFLQVVVSGVPNATTLRGGTDDFVLRYTLTNTSPTLSSLENALPQGNDLSLVIAQLSNSDQTSAIAGTSLSGSVRVTQLNVAPVPLPASFALGLAGMAVLFGVSRRRRTGST